MRVYGTKLVFASPLELLNNVRQASYDEGKNTIELSVGALVYADTESGKIISVGKLTLTDLHEARHLASFIEAKNQRGSPFHGVIIPSEGKLAKLGAYADFCSFDELAAYALDGYISFRPLRQLKSKLENRRRL